MKPITDVLGDSERRNGGLMRRMAFMLCLLSLGILGSVLTRAGAQDADTTVMPAPATAGPSCEERLENLTVYAQNLRQMRDNLEEQWSALAATIQRLKQAAAHAAAAEESSTQDVAPSASEDVIQGK